MINQRQTAIVAVTLLLALACFIEKREMAGLILMITTCINMIIISIGEER